MGRCDRLHQLGMRQNAFGFLYSKIESAPRWLLLCGNDTVADEAEAAATGLGHGGRGAAVVQHYRDIGSGLSKFRQGFVKPIQA
jgi:hypothetical protein